MNKTLLEQLSELSLAIDKAIHLAKMMDYPSVGHDGFLDAIVGNLVDAQDNFDTGKHLLAKKNLI